MLFGAVSAHGSEDVDEFVQFFFGNLLLLTSKLHLQLILDDTLLDIQPSSHMDTVLTSVKTGFPYSVIHSPYGFASSCLAVVLPLILLAISAYPMLHGEVATCR